ncbi:GNAT family N-acetyltransferase [uncultured Martelella sp.]|uniref:GNAT family N-acetyltransferase n=1 Tax=uncultured Martelella sp. TaxID=392331 RepID=UPI0029C79802|nr:GNAT family N-acetyltransferase [uncultured Martelella sp.]
MMKITLLNGQQAEAAIPALSALLADSIEDNASMGFMAPYDNEGVETYWQQVAAGVAAGSLVLLAAEIEGEIVGTVQAGFAQKPNQPHRADVMKLIVHRKVRGRGIARKLMETLDAVCIEADRWLLVLDTATGSDAEAIYPRLGWQRVGVVPDYALYPEGGYCGTTFFYKRLGDQPR